MLTYKESPLNKHFYADLQLEVPKNWGLFSAQGNQALRRKGLSLVKKLEKLSEKNALVCDHVAAIEHFYVSVKKSEEGKIYQGINDSNVNQLVVNFMNECASSVKLHTGVITSIIEREY